jgi:hypothetical protein
MPNAAPPERSRRGLSLAKTDPTAKLDRRSSVIDCPDGPLTPCAFGQEGACNRSGAQECGSPDVGVRGPFAASTSMPVAGLRRSAIALTPRGGSSGDEVRRSGASRGLGHTQVAGSRAAQANPSPAKGACASRGSSRGSRGAVDGGAFRLRRSHGQVARGGWCRSRALRMGSARASAVRREPRPCPCPSPVGETRHRRCCRDRGGDSAARPDRGTPRTICCAVQAAVGESVALKCTTRRR